MKKYILHIDAPFPLSVDAIMQEGISQDFAERVIVDDNSTIIVNEQELQELVKQAEDTEFGIYVGEPNEDNCLNFQDCWHLLDECEVTE